MDDDMVDARADGLTVSAHWGSMWVADPKHGPLPVLLLSLTVTTGVVDVVSILGLGRVFVANMTGNVVFTGFALTGVPGFSLAASLAALGGFLAGARAGGPLVERWGGHRGLLLRTGVAAALVLVVIGLLVGSVVPGSAMAVAALLAAAMGMQNTVVRKLAVPDLTTTVLTMTLTGIAADLRCSGSATIVRRVLAVSAMLLGAVVGSVLMLLAGIGWALGVVAVVMAGVVLAATLRSLRPAAWHRA